MQISILKEQSNTEQRVASSPESVKLLKKFDLEVLIEKDAGLLSGIKDNLFIDAGAKISSHADCLKADICLCVQMPLINDLKNLKDNSILIGLLNPYKNKESFNFLSNKKITSCSMELIPRISRAQSMDVLSSQANLVGYRSVIEAAKECGRVFPMMMTAAGRINPIKVMILGAGVSGLQAIATAKRLGAVVCATDVRVSTKEQVESLGAKFVMVDDEETKQAETSEGYAKEMSKEYKEKQSKLLAETISKQDIIISTALIPGKTAPVLINEKMVNSMLPGSVIVDLAVESGGNCPLSKLDKVVMHNDVKIIGYSNFISQVAKDASNLYAKNLVNFISLFFDKEKKFNIDWKDEIIEAVTLTHNGNIKLDKLK